uniref:NADH-ubiquinone oxidoreductase chain 4 n=1 Tax=Ichthyophthirius multifiliis TaxID=5932 RepID=G1FLE7_ICHMU|nr:NADH dehydrogenase subunit 4 [Ichthyophthirius multifiliis]AEL89289.1 NADH dehydrogenase subunit 4 [Ichthyophthirius multifiliis]
MILNYSLYLSKICFEFNLLLLILNLIIILLLNYYSYFRFEAIKFIFKKNSTYIKYINIFLFLITFIIHILSFILYLNYSYNQLLYINYSSILNINSIQLYNFYFIYNFKYFTNLFSVDLFGLSLIFLAYLIGFISILVLDTRFNLNNKKFIYYFNLFLIIVYLYSSIDNILFFFLFYEFLLIPSFLIIFYLSNSRRSIQASLYFIVWTQLGSFLVLLVLSFLIFTTGFLNFYDLLFYNFTSTECFFLFFFIFLGFGFKVPIWPFHYWLTKTHVESPSGFSIYLSGFLVKTALYGFYKILSNINIDMNTTIFLAVSIFGVIDSSLKMWGQTDLKKLVAYGTIQEMNLIYISLLLGDSNLIFVTIIFIITHALLSCLMFFLVDCIYRRFNSRSIVELNGLIHILPNLSITIILMIVFFSGLPGTLKFISEFSLFSNFINIIPFTSLLLIFISNVLGLIGFSKVWFNSLFGSLKKNTKNLSIDLSIKELYIISINFFFLFILSNFFFFIY